MNMINYIDDATNEIYAYDEEQVALGIVKAGLRLIGDEELAALRAPSLKELQESAIAAIRTSCSSDIFAGFTSSALGAVHSYPANIVDQQNLAACVVDSLINEGDLSYSTPFWCASSSGEWQMRPHTSAQIRQVQRDAKSAIIAAQKKSEVLISRISAADTAESVLAITWTTPNISQ